MDNQAERERKVLELLMNDSSIGTSAISKKLNVSIVTIRSDLNSLAEQGLLIRTRGGAVPAFHPSITERQKYRTDVKERIAKEAAKLINDGDTVMIEAGTTASMVAKFLLGKRNVRVVSNSMLLLPYARMNPSLHVTIVGGVFTPETESVLGSSAIKCFEQYHVDHAFIGTDGFSKERGLSNHHVDAAEVVRCMRERADKTVLLADSSKVNKNGFVSVMPLQKVDQIITDKDMSAADQEMIRECNIDLSLV